ncbi:MULTISPECIES: hypothetical protein [Hyphobacterium]|uniref:Uncharacterized protein n=1 Tax=Hyphobacterium vulgare TaxID=1736751 RepID=A0ABV6ZU94_9PROT
MSNRSADEIRRDALRVSLSVSEAVRRLNRMGHKISDSGLHTWAERRGYAIDTLLLRAPGADVPGDPCSRSGAERLAVAIKAYWRSRGHEVAVRIESGGWTKKLRSERFDVRSELVNGLPPRQP